MHRKKVAVALLMAVAIASAIVAAGALGVGMNEQENDRIPYPEPPDESVTYYVEGSQGTQTYPEEYEDYSEVQVEQEEVEDQVQAEIDSRRKEAGWGRAYSSRARSSVTRAQADNMYDRTYLAGVTPSGVTPVEQYKGTATECKAVERYVYRIDRPVETADGRQLEVSTSGVAADVTEEMLSDDRIMANMTTTDKLYRNVGIYMTTEPAQGGGTNLVTTTTIDFCTTQEQN